MICASFSWNKFRALVRPCPPTPTIAIFTFSLGATNLGPPSTCRGTRVNAAVAVATPRNCRRVARVLVFFPFIVSSRKMMDLLLHCLQDGIVDLAHAGEDLGVQFSDH